jgi:P4 family phage/plasmid primase-like protien
MTSPQAAIPDQLEGRGLRFTRLRRPVIGDSATGKAPLDRDFYDAGALAEDDPSLLEHLAAGGGFGLVGTYGDLIGFDADDSGELEALGIMARLPPTLADRAPHKTESLHLYYVCPGLPKTFHFYHPTKATEKDGELKRMELGQICAGRGHITGPGAPHWSGGRREIIDSSSLTEITVDDLRAILRGLAFSEDPTKTPTFDEAAGLEDPAGRRDDLEEIARKARRGRRGDGPSLSERIGDIRRVLTAYGWSPTTTSGDTLKGDIPGEASKSKTALAVDVKKGVWHCKHHDPSGGDAASLVALFEGLINCRGHDALRDATVFQAVIKACEEKGLIPDDGRGGGESSKRIPPMKARETAGDLFPLSSDDVLKATATGWKFSPAKAAAAFRREIPLKMASWDPKTIWWCDLGIWRPDGDRLLAGLCDDLGDEYSNGYQVNEVLRRLRVKLGWDRVDFDVASPYLIATKNGFTIDLRTGEARKTSPDDLISMPINAAYDPSARCPVFIEFLKGSCGNDTDRLTLCDHLAACAIAMEIEYILFLLGHGSNGKKVYAKFMLDLFGVGAGEAIGLEELSKSRFAVSFLMRARFCIGTEQNPTDVQTEMMKRISGGDWISADIKNVHERARFRPFTQLMYDTNGMPAIEDNSAGWQRRFVAVNMPFKFVDNPNENDPLQKKADRRLGEKLASEEEKSGVLNLLIERARAVCENFQITRRENDTVAYNKQSFSVRDFIDQFVEFYPDHRGLYQEPAGLLFDRFEEYARYTVGATVTRQKFSMILGKANGRTSEKITVEGINVRGFRGLRFNQTAFDEFISRIREDFKGTTENDLERPENDLKNDSSIDIRTTRTSYSIFSLIEKRYGGVGGAENDLTGEIEQGRSPRSTRSPPSEDTDFEKNKVVLRSFSERERVERAEEELEEEVDGEHVPISENLAEAERREAAQLAKFTTPGPKVSSEDGGDGAAREYSRPKTEADRSMTKKADEGDGRPPAAEEAEVLEAVAAAILVNWPGVPELKLWEMARARLGKPLPLVVVRRWLMESGYVEAGTKLNGAPLWNPPLASEGATA